MPDRLVRPGGFELQMFVEQYRIEHRFAPSIREIQEFFGCGSLSTCVKWLREFREEGFIEWLEGQPRTYRTPL